jgi:GntR family transcriptional repressor for pyruvate dehydrogenase complex
VRETYRRALLNGKDRARHLLEARLAIEVATAALAARRARAADLTAMERALDAFDATTTYDERARCDLAFHLALATASGNRLLPLLLEPLEDLLHEDRIEGLQRLTASAAADQHRRILAAVRARDPAAASAAMRAHLTAVGAAYGLPA